MSLTSQQVDVLGFVAKNGGAANEEVLRAEFGDNVGSLLTGMQPYLRRDSLVLRETSDVPRAPHGEVVTYVLTDAGRAAIG